VTNTNLKKGIPWRFGPNWQGQRCGAKTRRGTPCQRPARLPVGRCKLHGGTSTGPRTRYGLASLTEARTKHGKFTKEKRAEARRFAELSSSAAYALSSMSENTAINCLDNNLTAPKANEMVMSSSLTNFSKGKWTITTHWIYAN